MKKLASLLAVLFLLLTGRVQAEEPAEKFLDALRENGYYDVALLYLDDLNKGNLVGPDFKKEIPFERAKTLIRSTSALRDREKIEQSLDEAQTLLTAYASKNKSLKVSGKTLRFQGNLMYLRANSYLRQSESDRLTAGEKNELLTKARKLLNESLTSYTKARNQIRRLIDPNSPDVIILDDEDPSTIKEQELFRNLYTDVRVALPLVAEKLGDTYPPGNPERKKQLETAVAEYTKVYESYRKYLSGLKACVYAARCNNKLGKNQKALDLLTEIFELSDNSAIKRLKLEAYVLGCECWSSMKPYPYVEVIKQLEPAVGVLNRVEIRNPDWLRVQFELANAKKASSEAIKAKGGPRASSQSKSTLRAAAKIMRNVARTPGPLRDSARDTLAKWNVPLTAEADPNEKPPETFVDARQKGKDLISEIELMLSESNKLRSQIRATSDAAQRGALQKQLDESNKQIAEQAVLAIDVLNLALEMTDESTIRADVNNVRYLQCFCYFVSQKYFESAIIGDFLLLKYPTVEGTQQAMTVLIQSYSILMDQAAADQKSYYEDILKKTCDEVIDRWPGSNQAGTGASTMTRLMLNKKDFVNAESYFEKIPDASANKIPLGVRLGQRQFLDYKNKVSAGASKADLKPMLVKARDAMFNGVSRATLDEVDYETAVGALLLIEAHLELGEVDQAVQRLEGAGVAPLELVKQQHPAIFKSPYAATYSRETKKVAIKVYLAAMKNAEDKKKWTDKASGVLAGMRQEAEASNSPEAQARITIIYRLIAKALKDGFEELESKDKKVKFAQTLSSFLGDIEKESTDAKTVLWAGSTLLTVAEALVDVEADADAKPLFQSAVSALTRAEKMGFSGDPKEADMVKELKRQRAIANRGSGNYQQALDQFLALVNASSKPSLTMQIDLAETLQLQARAQKDPKLYVRAIKGKTEKDPKTKKSVRQIWGWEYIARATRKNEKFRDVFYQSLYKVAECKLEYGILSKSQKTIASAGKEIANERKRDPTFGGLEKWKAKYDELEKRVKAAGG